jgi:hypothetical protein
MGAQEVTNTSQGYENNHPTDNTNPPGNELILGGGLVQEFEPKDTIRKNATMSNYGLKNLNATPRRLLTNKYFNGKTDPFRQSSINYPVLRYADVLLIKAEALNEISGGNAEAFAALNAVRSRAKLTPVEGLSQTALRKAIWHERRVELAMEGQQWFDLVRQKEENGFPRLLTVMAAQGKNVQTKHLLFPVPQVEIDRNPKMTQNDGY